MHVRMCVASIDPRRRLFARRPPRRGMRICLQVYRLVGDVRPLVERRMVYWHGVRASSPDTCVYVCVCVYIYIYIYIYILYINIYIWVFRNSLRFVPRSQRRAETILRVIICDVPGLWFTSKNHSRLCSRFLCGFHREHETDQSTDPLIKIDGTPKLRREERCDTVCVFRVPWKWLSDRSLLTCQRITEKYGKNEMYNILVQQNVYFATVGWTFFVENTEKNSWVIFSYKTM